MSIEVTNTAGETLNLVDGANLYSGIDAQRSELGELTSLESDLVILAASIYLADLSVKRDEREQFVRSIKLSVPVVNYHAFERVKDRIKRCLRILSRDNWKIEFTRKQGVQDSGTEWPDGSGKTLLFSGGLDSLAGAFHLCEDSSPLALVSHVTHNLTVSNAQGSLFDRIRDFKGDLVKHIPWRVFGRQHKTFSFPKDGEREETQRTRSFLFLSLAAVVARRLGHRHLVVMAENGHFAIHLPLNSSRIGPFSTHTANPDFLNECQTMFREVFDCDALEILNPFQYFTKGEVVALIPKRHRQVLISDTVSCWRASRVSQTNHCGECVPCIMRRVSLESNGINFDVMTRNLFAENIGNLSPDDIGKRNFVDLAEFFCKFTESRISENNLMFEFPELFSDQIDSVRAIEMYRRSAAEFKTVVSRYPDICSLVQ